MPGYSRNDWARVRAWSTLSTIATIVTLGASSACRDINTDPAALASVGFDTLPAPSVVMGDSMRDTFGVAQPLHGNAFNIQGNVLSGFPIRYRQLDTGVTVDSLTGYVVAGDSALATGIRLLVDAAGLQTQTQTLYVVRAPDTLVVVDSLDSLTYSLTDSTVNVSRQLSVATRHIDGDSLLTVPAWVVSFAIQYHPPAVTTTPGADTLVAQLVGINGQPTRAVSGDAGSGTAAIGVRIRPLYLTSLNDSVVVIATAKYRGLPIRGSGKRLVLHIKSLGS